MPGNWRVRWRWRWAEKAAGAPTWRRPAARMPEHWMRRWKRCIGTSRGNCDGIVCCIGGWGGTDGVGVRDRAPAARGEDGSDREGVRGEFDLSLSHQYVLLHHAGAARNRQHPDDQPE